MNTDATLPLPSTAKSVVVVERQEDPRVWYRIHCSRNWIVYLDELPVGRLPEGGRLAIPIGTGSHNIFFSLETSLASLPKTPGFSVTSPDHNNLVFRIGAEDTVLCRGIYVVGTRQLKSDETETVPATEAASPSPTVQQKPETPIPVADVSGTFQAPQPFKFSGVFWQKTAILFGFYWLFRWLFPSVLPSSLRELDFRMTLVPCAILGLVWTGISYLMRLGAKPK